MAAAAIPPTTNRYTMICSGRRLADLGKSFDIGRKIRGEKSRRESDGAVLTRDGPAVGSDLHCGRRGGVRMRRRGRGIREEFRGEAANCKRSKQPAEKRFSRVWVAHGRSSSGHGQRASNPAPILK